MYIVTGTAFDVLLIVMVRATHPHKLYVCLVLPFKIVVQVNFI